MMYGDGPIVDPARPMGLLRAMQGGPPRSFLPQQMPQAPPVAFPQGPQLPPNTAGPDVHYPGGIGNFWSNNGRTFNIPAAQSLADQSAPALGVLPSQMNFNPQNFPGANVKKIFGPGGSFVPHLMGNLS